ncbi:acetylxylan esterase [Subtercola sp. RTI3]|uniref:acetylxylan esterase n=1 Tax=Subtercola sp. RTI3 TaxID=3048639 RepID=UPI002B23E5E1|nr:acetylxylan esterase [Subtercola sp. RTI3]MEA9986668.1 acetylxylan esterase [Subtercola sp. RTI3]
MFVDLPESELRNYRSTQVEPDDFDEFWASTLAGSRAAAPATTATATATATAESSTVNRTDSISTGVVVTKVDCGLTTLDIYDVTFPGFAGQPVKAWLRVPAGALDAAPSPARTALPAVVEFVGYGGGRGHATDNLFWASAGFAHLHMDTRGQGSTWSSGDTGDDEGAGAGSSTAPQHPGFMTRGITSPETYYYRRLITDAVRAVDAVKTLDAIDPQRVAVIGRSQGGGLALAVAGLVPGLVAAIPLVPFLCDFPRAIVMTDNDPYKEIGRYLAVHREQVGQVLDTLSYFDGVNFAKRASAPAWFSTALMDPVCPPSTVFGAFNEYAGEKHITVWPFNGHEGGGVDDNSMALAALKAVAPISASPL